MKTQIYMSSILKQCVVRSCQTNLTLNQKVKIKCLKEQSVNKKFTRTIMIKTSTANKK